jgi:beta-aspartyl-peptidase (threonine type)
MAYGGASLEGAADAVIHGTLPTLGGDGGLIAADAEGNLALPFNSEGMYRAGIDGRGHRLLAIYPDE